MLKYLISRLLLLIPTLLIIFLLTYTLATTGPINPVLIMRQQLGVQGITMSVEAERQLRQELGLDQPFLVQFGRYVGNILRGDFGRSFYSRREVGPAIAATFHISAQLGLMAMIFLVIFGIPLGALAALKQNTWIDYLIVGSSLLLRSIPTFVLGPMILIILVLWLQVIRPPLGWQGLFSNSGILVSALLAVGPMAVVIRQTRAGILEVVSSDYVRTARAKGLPEILVVSRHILRNALIPVVTSLGLLVSSLITGTVFLDNIFGLAGFGGLVSRSITTRDYPMLMSTVMISAFLVMGSNLLVDMLYPFVDPRVTYD